jgi:hypothetical protein
MEAMYLEDLTDSTEILLDNKQRVRARVEPRNPVASTTSGSGRSDRSAAMLARRPASRSFTVIINEWNAFGKL